MICYRGEKDIYNLSGGNIHCTNLINPGKLTNPLQDQSEAALYTFLGQEQLRPGEPDQLKHDGGQERRHANQCELRPGLRDPLGQGGIEAGSYESISWQCQVNRLIH